ncbi:MAG: GH3 auxin-responsive promoter family protein [Cytophagales bacterium]|nr:GH3 auxin-responsive promoter family protein [Cytophagales bacterium]
MGIKACLSKPFASLIARNIKNWSNKPVETQDKVFKKLVIAAKDTLFGQEHDFGSIRDHQDFKERVPVRNYEALSGYFNKIIEGQENVLWKGKPIYLSKTSGTTSGAKYIPITKGSLRNHLNAARDALLLYIAQTGKTGFVDGKMIFLQGNPELDKTGNIPVGRLSGIVAHHVPVWLQKNRMPSYSINCIEDWEAKVDAIVEETLKEDMRLISGIPPWVQMYFDKLIERSGKQNIAEIFPNFSLFVHGGVNYQPYQKSIENTIGKSIDVIETYPASEGFIAYQDSFTAESLSGDSAGSVGLLLLLNNGIFYEFIPANEYFSKNPTRLSIGEVEIGVNYAIILSTNAGLWGYSIGDTVQFVSKNPYRLIVTGRIEHYISAFGEHVIASEVEAALLAVAKEESVSITEFTVAPQVNPPAGETPYHEWYIEFNDPPMDIAAFAKRVDERLCEKNIYYNDLITGSVLKPLKIREMKKNAFRKYMKSKGKLGGQNKVPRLANDRNIADELEVWIE